MNLRLVLQKGPHEYTLDRVVFSEILDYGLLSIISEIYSEFQVKVLLNS